MDAAGLFVTRHAIERFMARWPKPVKPACWQAELSRLLSAATEEHIEATVLRLLNNGMKPARYFVAEGWRFVTDMEGARLMTCERMIFRGLKKKHVTVKDRRRMRREHK